MKPNIGEEDSFIRIIISMLTVGICLANDTTFGYLGLIPVVASLFKWSPIYHILGINTYDRRTKLSSNI